MTLSAEKIAVQTGSLDLSEYVDAIEQSRPLKGWVRVGEQTTAETPGRTWLQANFRTNDNTSMRELQCSFARLMATSFVSSISGHLKIGFIMPSRPLAASGSSQIGRNLPLTTWGLKPTLFQEGSEYHPAFCIQIRQNGSSRIIQTALAASACEAVSS